MTTADNVPLVCCAICCAAAKVSKLTLFHLPSRCSVMRRVFICVESSYYTCLVAQLFDEFRCGLFRRPRDEFGFLCFLRNVDAFDALGGRVRHTEQGAFNGRDFLLLGGHDALERRVARLV